MFALRSHVAIYHILQMFHSNLPLGLEPFWLPPCNLQTAPTALPRQSMSDRLSKGSPDLQLGYPVLQNSKTTATQPRSQPERPLH